MVAPRIPRNSPLFVQPADMQHPAQAANDAAMQAQQRIDCIRRRASLPPAQYMTPAECCTEVGANQPQVIVARWPSRWLRLAFWLGVFAPWGAVIAAAVWHSELWQTAALLAGL